MIKQISTAFILLVISSTLHAESLSIEGQWMMTTAKIGNNTEEVYQMLLFRQDGYAEMEGRVFGSWEKGKDGKDITIESEMIEEFNGSWNIISRHEGEIILESGGKSLSLGKYDINSVEKENSKSSLSGVWKLDRKDEDGADVYLNFMLPDELAAVYIGSGFSGRGNGRWQWITNKDTGSLILMMHNRMLRGKWTAAVTEEGKLSISRNNDTITAGRIKQNGKNREKLNLSYGEETEENASGSSGEKILPWSNPEEFMTSLQKVKEVSYIKSILVNELDIFLTENISSEVSVDESYGSIEMNRIFDGISAYGYSGYNPFYPVEEPDSYRISGEKEITVPAGRFNCAVVDIYDDFNERKIRLYMIKNLPGIYAKIIILSREFDDENYIMYELKNIKQTYG